MCGANAQRDRYSAFLAKHTSNDVLDKRQAVLSWPGENLLLERSVSRARDEAAKRRICPASFGLNRRQSCLPVNDRSTIVDVGKVISVAGETADIAVRTPGFNHGEWCQRNTLFLGLFLSVLELFYHFVIFFVDLVHLLFDCLVRFLPPFPKFSVNKWFDGHRN